MQPNETLKPRVPSAPEQGAKRPDDEWYNRMKLNLEQKTASEKGKPGEGKEQGEKGLKKALTAFGDMVRDVGTASSMATEKFDGDSAFMHAARGAVTFGVGAGLEKAMDFVWDKVWSGEIPFYDKSKFGEGMVEGLNAFAVRNNLTSRLTYLIKESAQDLSLAIFYNFLAFRSQPILPKTGPEHLVRSLWMDVLEAFALPSLPVDEKIKAEKGSVGMLKPKIEKARELWHNVDRIRINKPNMVRGEDGKEYAQANYVPLYPEDAQNALTKLDELINKKSAHEKKLKDYERTYNPLPLENFLRGISGLSNPITQLGAEWFVLGFKTLRDNYIEVRKVRTEKGGLAGKKVLMPKKEKWQDRRTGSDQRGKYNDKKSWSNEWRQGDRKDYIKDKKTIYYGRGNAEDSLNEEELIEKLI